MPLTGRMATEADVAQLAAMNRQLIRDEGHRYPMSLMELEDRMRGWEPGFFCHSLTAKQPPVPQGELSSRTNSSWKAASEPSSPREN